MNQKNLPKEKSIKQEGAHWGHRLADVLKEKELSRRQAAKLISISPATLDQWVTKGVSPQNYGSLMRLCEKLEISFSWLLCGIDQSPQNTLSLSQAFTEQEIFSDLCRVTITRLKPRENKK